MYIETIETKECPQPRDIAQGPDGLYVVGLGVISVYSHGVFVRSLNLRPSSLKFSQFRAICFDFNDHIIVSDHHHGVYIFTPRGECVGHVSNAVIPSPAGVTVDEDGFVYVCSFTNDGRVFVL